MPEPLQILLDPISLAVLAICAALVHVWHRAMHKSHCPLGTTQQGVA